jgi:hypothetical protein
MQALTVLLLELSFATVNLPQDGEEILSSAKKLIRWLRTMKANNEIADRAYTIAFGIFQKLAPRVSVDISDLLREDAAIAANPGTRDSKSQSMSDRDNQGFRGQRCESGFNDTQTGYASMFAFPSGAIQENLLTPTLTDSGGTLLPNLPPYGPSFGHPFSTIYDEQYPFTFSETLFNVDPLMSDVPYQELPFSET